MKELIIGILCTLIGILGGCFIARWQYNVEREKIKIELFVETKEFSAELLNQYKEMLNAEIEISYYSVMLQNSMATKTYSYENRYDQFHLEKIQLETQENLKNQECFRTELNECSLKIKRLQKNLSKNYSKIYFYFDVNHELEQIINKVKIFKFIRGATFTRPNNSKISHHDKLKRWKESAQQQGDLYIKKYFAKPHKTLLKKIETQIQEGGLLF